MVNWLIKMITVEVKMTKFVNRSFAQATEKYLKNCGPKWPHVPSEEFSSERCGGWLLYDASNMYIGWVGNLGEVRPSSYADTDSTTVLDRSGVSLSEV